jgi:hypothetical protein
MRVILRFVVMTGPRVEREGFAVARSPARLSVRTSRLTAERKPKTQFYALWPRLIFTI